MVKRRKMSKAKISRAKRRIKRVHRAVSSFFTTQHWFTPYFTPRRLKRR